MGGFIGGKDKPAPKPTEPKEVDTGATRQQRLEASRRRARRAGRRSLLGYNSAADEEKTTLGAG